MIGGFFSGVKGVLHLACGFSIGADRVRPVVQTVMQNPVGASLLAKDSRAPQSVSQPALSLTPIASKLAPTVGNVIDLRCTAPRSHESSPGHAGNP
ncbi:hypothetical protein C1X65_10400 [Pseudomonas sp. FW305-70]|nr:hypothetical protein C1X65_10400 [Pseudomonas sp. FW305-70]